MRDRARAVPLRLPGRSMIFVALPLLLLSLAGMLYTAFAIYAVRRFRRRPAPPAVAAEPVSLLKPLHGPEPRLRDNLRTFLDQRWDAPIQMVAGAARADDPALLAARAVGAEIVTGPGPAGANAKIANLATMLPYAAHDLLVLSDSDMAVPRHYLSSLAATLAEPGVGAATCAYRGRGDAGRWSELAAAGISYQFLPSVLVAVSLGLDVPAMGSTIALRQRTLDRIGGFARFADVLADDNAIGAAVGALGQRVALPPLVLVHGCAETSLRAVLRQELRWSATIRGVSRASHFGLIATFPVAFALLAIPFAPAWGLLALGAATAVRLVLAEEIDWLCDAPSAPRWMLLPRDCLSFAIFVAALFARRIEWRGAALEMGAEGRIARRAAP